MLADVLKSDMDDEEVVITKCYILEDKDEPRIVTEDDYMRELVHNVSMEGYSNDEFVQETADLLDISKSVAGTRQPIAASISSDKVVAPPYSPELMLVFMQIDEMVHRCVESKAQDFVGRDWQLLPVKPRKLTLEYDEEDTPENSTPPESAHKDLETVHKFLANCNSIYGFEGTLLRAAQEYEGIGWAAIEVIRNPQMQVVGIAPVPATKLRVLLGWEGFVESDGPTKKVYYQPFGHKVVSKSRQDPNTSKPAYYDPEQDGELTPSNAEFSMVDYQTGKPTTDFMRSANEVIWIQKHHPSTIYYGVSDSLAATTHILANDNIRKYLLQFFEHNTVPRYVVVIKGAKLGDDVERTILNYFSSQIRGRAHKTLVIPIPSGRGNIEVTFEKLDSAPSDGWFKESGDQASNCTRVAHGVPAAIATVADGASLGSGKGTAQSETYKDRVVNPAQKKWADIVTKLFKFGLGVTTIRLKFTELDIRDQEAEMRIETQFIDRGIKSINEVRNKLGLPPTAGGDRLFIKTTKGLVFLDEFPGMVSADSDDGSDAGGDNSPDLPAPKVTENSVRQVLDSKNNP